MDKEVNTYSFKSNSIFFLQFKLISGCSSCTFTTHNQPSTYLLITEHTDNQLAASNFFISAEKYLGSISQFGAKQV